MCKIFSWTRSTVSGAGQKALLDFPGIRKVLVSLRVFQQTHLWPCCEEDGAWGPWFSFQLHWTFAWLPRQADPVRHLLTTEQCQHLRGLWWTQLPNSNNFKTQVWSGDLTQASDTAADRSGHWAGLSSAASPRPTFHQQAQDASSSFSKINSLLNSIQIAFPSQKGHTPWTLWMPRSSRRQVRWASRAGQQEKQQVGGAAWPCSAATTGDMEDPFGSLSSDLLLVVCSVM